MKTIDQNVYLSSLYLKALPDFLSGILVKGYFSCYNNQLTSLEGSPAEVGGDFSCSYNQLTSLEGAPTEVGGDFYCKNNKVKFTEEDVRKVCNVKGRVYC